MKTESTEEMREIKFKAIRKDNGKWVYGDLIHVVNHKSGKTYILPVVGGVLPLSGCDPLDGYEVYPETIGQFTGIKDKNRVEIYEGDICNNCNETGVITWLDNYTLYGLREYKDGQIISDRYPLFRYYELEVIGNIHDKHKQQ